MIACSMLHNIPLPSNGLGTSVSFPIDDKDVVRKLLRLVDAISSCMIDKNNGDGWWVGTSACI
jgi:hypothetical protein